MTEITTYLKRELKSDVCSIYLLNRNDDQTLTLAATEGLHQDAIDSVSMLTSEGLTGLAYTSNEYTFIREANQHPQFKYFPGIGEEPFQTFIGIPLKSSLHTFGVLVFQFKRRKNNTRMQQKLLTAVAAQVSGLVLRHYMLESPLNMDRYASGNEVVLQGVPLSEGIAIGHPVRVIYRFIESAAVDIDPEAELKSMESAFSRTSRDLRVLARRMKRQGAAAESEIFHTHLLMLEDSSFKKEVVRHIQDFHKSAAFSVRHVADKLIQKFHSFSDPYLRERAADIDDICQRLMTHLGVIAKQADLTENSIIISDRLTPGETASLDLEKVSAFITERDGVTSHTAILAKNRNMPAVTGITNLFEVTEYTRQIIVDGYQGTVIINPTEETLRRCGQQQQHSQRRRQLDQRRPTPQGPINLPDGESVSFYANVSSLLDAQKSGQDSACGIGLVRTEIFYLQNDGAFDRNQQIETYRQIVKAFEHGIIIFRLFDIGSDKKSTKESKEENPALGYRGSRLLLGERQFMQEQIEALLQVIGENAHRNDIKIMVPFVSDPEEFFAIHNIILERATEMNVTTPQIGVMLEIPSAVFAMDELATKADFFSVGTNDLFQYFFALDRGDPQVSNYYHPHNPAFLRLLQMVLDKSRQLDRPVEICGEVATDRAILRQLIAMGYRTFSVNPYVINGLKRFLQREFGAKEE
nr:phosphoenolpyruvate--protein phosphotransferase [Desulfurispira natronophila]